jgi:molybdate transport system regulatory protein
MTVNTQCRRDHAKRRRPAKHRTLRSPGWPEPAKQSKEGAAVCLGKRDAMANDPGISIRVILDADTQMGPGKVGLLQSIDETGSIAAAGRQLGMSYKRAWYLIDTMNAYFHEPVVISTKGGNARGGAKLTETGRVALRIYRQMEAKARRAVAHDLQSLVSLTAKSPVDRAK